MKEQSPLNISIQDQISERSLVSYLRKLKSNTASNRSEITEVPVQKKMTNLPSPEERATASDLYEFGNYVAFCVKVKGYAHFETPSNCQDAFAIKQTDQAMIVAIADGHGSKSHYLSEFGAQFAVEASLDLLTKIVGQYGIDDKPEIIFRDIKENFPRQLYGEWNKRVQQHAMTRTDIKLPATEAEIRTIYGTTAMFVVSVGDTFLYGKLDGDIVVYSNRQYDALETENNLYGMEAYSLCHEKDAINKWIFGVSKHPDFLTILTDGFRNACGTFGELEHLYKGIEVVRNHTNCYGAAQAKQVLPEFLCRLSDGGSADDITMCCMVNKDCLQENKEHEVTKA